MSGTIRDLIAHVIKQAQPSWREPNEYAAADAVLAFLGDLDGSAIAALVASHLRGDRQEIERLRAEVAMCSEQIGDLMNDVAESADELARLRAVAEAARAFCKRPGVFTRPPCAGCGEAPGPHTLGQWVHASDCTLDALRSALSSLDQETP